MKKLRINKKQSVIIITTTICLAILITIIGITYANWTRTATQTGVNVINSSCFNIDFNGENDINLAKGYLISDEDGAKLVPYTFTIKNTCDLWANYQINLETLSQASSVKVLPEEYVRVNLTTKDVMLKNTTLTNDIATTKTLADADKAYKLYNSVLAPGISKSFELRLWMDKDTPAIEEAMNATFKSKITISFSPKDTNDNLPTLIEREEYAISFWEKCTSITNIVIENKVTGVSGATNTWDVSTAEDGRIMAYLVPNNEEENRFTLYLQGDGGIKANPNSTKLFYDFNNLEKIEGLEYLNTSETTNMESMFAYTATSSTGLDIDLSNFDTSNVTNMKKMFHASNRNMKKIFIDLTNFNTSNVTDMSYMFQDFANGNVVEDVNVIMGDKFVGDNLLTMERMFSYFARYAKGDVKVLFGNNFNATKLENANNAFEYVSTDSHNITIDLGDNFNASKLESCYQFFYFVGCNMTGDLYINLGNNFNIQKATSVYEMFNTAGRGDTTKKNTNRKVEIYLGDNFNGNSIETARKIFNNVGMYSNDVTIDLGNNFGGAKITNFQSAFNNVGYMNYNDNNGKFILNTGNNFNLASVNDLLYSFSGAKNINGTITITSTSIPSNSYFSSTAIGPNANLVINYSSANEALIESYIATKDANAKISKGICID